MAATSDALAHVLGTHTFTSQDQENFAAWSQDCNPMHVDAVAARRLLSGRQVVHGIHTLLRALDLWARRGPVSAYWVECGFTHPVSVGDRVVFTMWDDGCGAVRLAASVDGLHCTEITIGPARPAPSATPAGPPPPLRIVGGLAAPLDEAPGSQSEQTLRVPCQDSSAVAAAFPAAAAAWGPVALSAIAGLSYMVGMVCPGLHSVFSSADFSLDRDRPPIDIPLDFTVHKYDPRFKLFRIGFSGPTHGELRAFQRPPPQLQPSTADVQAHVDGSGFKPGPQGQNLVIGGSRGLGETTAKVLAVIGADVTITYAAGREDALVVAADIASHGLGTCQALQFDLLADDFHTLALDTSALQGVYYFATPRIYAKRSGLFDQAQFDGFVDFYLRRFYQLCMWLEATDRATPLKVYLPSTVFITDRPKGMTEYAMVKAAAEVLADDLNRSLRNVRVIHSRLPRLATDQTASILKVSVGSNLETMLEVVRTMQV